MSLGVYLRYQDDADETPSIGWGKKENVERDHALMGLSGKYLYIGDVDEKTNSHWPPNCNFLEEDVRCYKIENKQVVYSPIKARKFHTDRVRQERDFATLDVDFMKALEKGADTSTILAKKQILRDAPNHPIWDTCVTLQDFKNVTLAKILSTASQ